MVILLTKSTNSKMSFVMVQCHHFGKATLKLFKSFLTTLWSIRLGDWDLDQKVSELMLPCFMCTAGKTMPNTLLTVGQADSNSQTLIPIFTLSLSKGTSVSEDLLTASTIYLQTWSKSRPSTKIKKGQEVLLDTIFLREKSQDGSSQAM